MEFIAKKTSIESQKTQCAVVFCRGKKLLASAAGLDESQAGVITAALANGQLSDDDTGTQWLTLPGGDNKRSYRSALVVNLGKPKTGRNANPTELSAEELRKVAEKLAAALTASKLKDATVFFDDLSIDEDTLSGGAVATIAAQIATELEKAAYRFSMKTKPEAPSLNKLTFVAGDQNTLKQLREGAKTGSALGQGINYARELGNLPGNVCTPTYLATQAKSLAAGCEKMTAKSLNEKQMEKLGMGSFLSVSKGSDEEGKLIVMEYKGSSKSKAPHVLVGKGITFDTGGISIKPGAGMDEMKFDMCGAASVLGTMKALIEMDANVHVVGVIAAAENMPSGRASKPGDIVKSMSGQTIEILNTDAEGRLVLCDALTYVERFKPKSVVDIATLTGACVVALGNHAAGLYANKQPLADALIKAGEKAHDRAWQMPLWDDYQKQLDSNFADMANIGGPAGGSITAACFLSRFAKKYAWAHLDIAGVAWHSGAKKGATGRPVSLLVNYLLNN